jgi:3-oxoacyl-[acyl-carrier-protein] synthase-1
VNETIPLSVYGAGMITAVGLRWATTCAAICAQISGCRRDNLWDPEAGEELQVARPRTRQWWEGPDMLAAHAASAVAECHGALPTGVAPARVPILLLLSPPTRPCRVPDLPQLVAAELERRLGAPLPVGSCAFSGGSTGLLAAFHHSSKLIRSHRADMTIIVGVESFLRQPIADAYIEARRILTSGNSNGFIPGEAACAVLLGRPRTTLGGELRIIGWGAGIERGTITSETPLSGDGLTQAIRSALCVAGLQWRDTHFWLTDQNAEAYKFKESTIAQIRLERRDEPATVPFRTWHPIEFVGEIGAALGPLLLGLAAYAAQRGHTRGPRALMHLSEDDGDRAGFVLEWVTGGNQNGS